MDDRLKVVDESGVEILFADFAGLPPEKIVGYFPRITEICIARKIRYNILDVSNTHTTQEIKKGSEESIRNVEARNGPIYNSLIGLRGLQKMIANAISRRSYFATDYADAVRWLLTKAKK